MRQISFTLVRALGLFACNTKQVDKAKISNDAIKQLFRLLKPTL